MSARFYELLYLGYFSNYVLISVVFGIGIGFLVSDRKIEPIGKPSRTATETVVVGDR